MKSTFWLNRCHLARRVGVREPRPHHPEPHNMRAKKHPLPPILVGTTASKRFETRNDLSGLGNKRQMGFACKLAYGKKTSCQIFPPALLSRLLHYKKPRDRITRQSLPSAASTRDSRKLPRTRSRPVERALCGLSPGFHLTPPICCGNASAQVMEFEQCVHRTLPSKRRTRRHQNQKFANRASDTTENWNI